jgi:hypothetical protein
MKCISYNNKEYTTIAALLADNNIADPVLAGYLKNKLQGAMLGDILTAETLENIFTTAGFTRDSATTLRLEPSVNAENSSVPTVESLTTPSFSVTENPLEEILTVDLATAKEEGATTAELENIKTYANSKGYTVKLNFPMLETSTFDNLVEIQSALEEEALSAINTAMNPYPKEAARRHGLKNQIESLLEDYTVYLKDYTNSSFLTQAQKDLLTTAHLPLMNKLQEAEVLLSLSERNAEAILEIENSLTGILAYIQDTNNIPAAIMVDNLNSMASTTNLSKEITDIIINKNKFC